MKRLFIYTLAVAAVLCSCAKQTTTSTGVSLQEYIEAYASKYYPNAEQTELGAYVISETKGTGIPVEDSVYVRVDYTIYDLYGDITSTSSLKLNKQLGNYTSYFYYGPVFWDRGEEFNLRYAGIEEALEGMKVGGRKKVLIPGWLLTTDRHSTKEEYIASASSTTSYIYDFTVYDATCDTETWEKDSIATYIAENYPTAVEDSLGGFYYIQTQAPSDDTVLTDEDSVYVYYVARRLDGMAFDSNIADTAKVYNFYNSSNTYSKKKINLQDDEDEEEDYTDITMGSSSSLIEGFAYALDRMKYGEKATVIFWSGMGYSSSGTGKVVPGYCPLRFDIEVLDKE